MTIKRYAGIVLSAGLSTRFKLWKPSVLINNIPLIFYSVKPMLKVCDKVIVVGGYNIEKLKNMFDGHSFFSREELEKITVVENMGYNSGMFSSVRTGIVASGEDYNGVFIIPGDMPAVSEATYLKIKDTFESSKCSVIIPAINILAENPEHGIIKGHPILISNEVSESIKKQDESAILRDVIKLYEQKILIVEDKGICLDVDNETDLEKVLTYFLSKEKQEQRDARSI